MNYCLCRQHEFGWRTKYDSLEYFLYPEGSIKVRLYSRRQRVRPCTNYWAFKMINYRWILLSLHLARFYSLFLLWEQISLNQEHSITSQTASFAVNYLCEAEKDGLAVKTRASFFSFVTATFASSRNWSYQFLNMAQINVLIWLTISYCTCLCSKPTGIVYYIHL